MLMRAMCNPTYAHNWQTEPASFSRKQSQRQRSRSKSQRRALYEIKAWLCTYALSLSIQRIPRRLFHTNHPYCETHAYVLPSLQLLYIADRIAHPVHRSGAHWATRSWFFFLFNLGHLCFIIKPWMELAFHVMHASIQLYMRGTHEEEYIA